MHPYLPPIKLFFCEPSRSLPILSHSLFQVFFNELGDGVKHLKIEEKPWEVLYQFAEKKNILLLF